MQPNGFTRLLPTIGMTAGSLLGSLTDEFTGPVGTIGGGALGGDAGQWLENKLTGQQTTAGELGKQALIGGGSALAGLGIGKLFGGVGGALTDFGASKAAQSEAITPLEENTINKMNFGALSDKTQQALNLGKNQEFLKGLGIDSTNPYTMKQAAGAGLELNDVANQAISQSEPINFQKDISSKLFIKDMPQASKNAIDRALTKAGINDINNAVNPMQARSFAQGINEEMRPLYNLISKAENAGQIEQASNLESQYNQLKDIYDSVNNALFTGNDNVDNFIKNYATTPEQRLALQSKYGEKLGSHIADTLDNAQGGKDLLNAMRPFAQMNDASNIAIKDIENVPISSRATLRAKAATPAQDTKSSNLAKLIKPALALGGVEEASNSKNKALQALGLIATLPEASSLIENGTAPTIAGKLSSLLGRIAPTVATATAGLATAQQPQPQANVNQGQNNMNPYAVAPTGFAPSPLAMEGTIGLAGMMDPYVAGQYAPMAQAAIPTLQKARVAQAGLTQAEQNLMSAGGGQGLLGGLAAILQGRLTGGPVRQYQSSLQALQPELQALGINLPLPSVTSTQAAAQAQLAQLQAALGGYL